MKITTAIAIVWLSVAIAISVGIYVTGSILCLFAFLVPATLHWKGGTDE